MEIPQNTRQFIAGILADNLKTLNRIKLEVWE